MVDYQKKLHELSRKKRGSKSWRLILGHCRLMVQRLGQELPRPLPARTEIPNTEQQLRTELKHLRRVRNTRTRNRNIPVNILS